MGAVRVSPPGALAKNNDRLHTTIEGRYISVVNRNGELFSFDSTCYHAGGPLGLGDIEDIQGEDCIVCPWHTYQVSLRTGAKLYQALEMGPDKKLVPSGWKRKEHAQRVHAVELRKDGVYVTLDKSGKWDSDDYGTNALCGERSKNGNRTEVKAGRDGHVNGGYGSNKVHLPKRSGHVLAGPRGAGKQHLGSSLLSGSSSNKTSNPLASIGAAGEAASGAANSSSSRSTEEGGVWTTMHIATPPTRDGKSAIRLRLAPSVAPSSPGKKKASGPPSRDELRACLEQIGMWDAPSSSRSSKDTPGIGLEGLLRTTHLLVRAVIGGTTIERPYTPVESGRHATARVSAISKDKTSTNYAVELAIKVYAQGAMSSFLSTLKAGATLEVRPDFDSYLFRKLQKLESAHMKPEHVRGLVLFAGGSGVTPMLQLAHQALAGSKLPVTLIYAASSQAELMAVDEVLALAKLAGPRIAIHFVLTAAAPKPKRLVVSVKVNGKAHVVSDVIHGRVTSELVRGMVQGADQLPPKQWMVFAWCGPEGFKNVASAGVSALGYVNAKNSVFLPYSG